MVSQQLSVLPWTFPPTPNVDLVNRESYPKSTQSFNSRSAYQWYRLALMLGISTLITLFLLSAGWQATDAALLSKLNKFISTSHHGLHTRVDTTIYDAILPRMQTAMLGSQRGSWEQGAVAVALIELNNPMLSTFSNSFTFSPSIPESSAEFPMQVVQIARDAITRQAPDGRLSEELGGSIDGSALDSASVGEAVLLASFLLPDKGQAGYYRSRADAQLQFMFSSACPKDANGVMSQRTEDLQYWSDAVFMGPPLLAYYGALSSDSYLMQQAYLQVKGYRSYLRKTDIQNVWGHVYDASGKYWVDSNNWATGNGWAAAGIVRVLSCMVTSSIHGNFVSQQNDLAAWAKEIIDAAWSHASSDTGLLYNYLDQGPSTTFEDTAGSALIAAATYRLAALAPNFVSASSLAAAEKARVAVMKGVDPLGMVYPSVNALSWGSVGSGSVESVAFAIMMHSAWRDYYAGTSRKWSL